MNILITGCAGFIASHIIEELLKDKTNNLVGIDNFYSGTSENLNYIESIDKEKKFTFYEEDIRNFDEIDLIIKENKIEQVYHLAAIVSVQDSIENPLLSNSVNVNGTLNILEASRLNNVSRIVFSSSAAVYGDDPMLPKTEESILKPISPYGYEKLIGEQYMKLYSELYNIETVSLRYFNVYGERQNAKSDYSGVISIFNDRFKNNTIPSIYGDGNQYRDFVYVKDVAIANIKAMNMINISSEIFCVGTSVKTSINDLFKIMNKKFSKNYEPVYLDARVGDILESVSDNSKIKEHLNLVKFAKFEDKVINI